MHKNNYLIYSMVIFKEIECMCRVVDNKIINAPKQQSMTCHMTNGKFSVFPLINKDC